MSPSEVNLFRSVLPLIATFGRAEKEFAAALLVRACVRNGDRWQPVSPRVIGETMRADAEPGGPWERLQYNPFLPTPDFQGLVDDGFAAFVGASEGEGDPPIEFTPRGIERLAGAA